MPEACRPSGVLRKKNNVIVCCANEAVTTVREFLSQRKLPCLASLKENTPGTGRVFR